MDTKRFTEITWQEAVVKWSNGEHVFSSTGHTYYMKDDVLYFFFGNESNGAESTAFFNDITKGTWYVKTPFNVRSEMLARPNEWVGAFKLENYNRWVKIGFSSEQMCAVKTESKGTKKPNEFCSVANYPDFEHCIPIEDVPKEEL